MFHRHPGKTDRGAAPGSPDRRVERPWRGIYLTVLGTGLISVNDAAMKWVVGDHPVGEAIFVRGLFAVFPIALLMMHQGGWRAARWVSLRDQVSCAAFLVAAIFLFIFSLSRLPLATATIIIYASPLFVTALAPLLLAERVGWRRWSAVALGFAGTLLVIRPGGGDFTWLLTLPLAVALLSAVRDIVTRRLLARESALSMLVFSNLAVTLCALPTAAFGWTALAPGDIALLALAGLGFGFGIYCLTESLRFAEASLLAPLKYSGVVWAVILGYLVWSDLPGLEVLFGAVLIVASGLFILRREKRLGAVKSLTDDSAAM
jgi:drug/metabolite transporter (DMT)-like permease